MNNYRLNQPLPEENSTLGVWGIEFGGFWKVRTQLQMLLGVLAQLHAEHLILQPVCWLHS